MTSELQLKKEIAFSHRARQMEGISRQEKCTKRRPEDMTVSNALRYHSVSSTCLNDTTEEAELSSFQLL